MKKAIEAVETGESGVNIAALDFGVPKSTLKDRISGRVSHGRKPGPKPYLTPGEEKELAEFVKSCAIQKPIPRARLLTSAASLAAIEEKEKQKQKQEQLEEKQRKRREREEKKKQKEQEVRRKEEEGRRKS